jgi:hypothetical protein
MDAQAWGNRPNTKWKLQFDGKIIGDDSTVTVAQAVFVGKLLGRDSWLDCLPYIGPEACTAWITVLTAPGDGEMSSDEFLEHMKKIMDMKLDDLFNCLILE